MPTPAPDPSSLAALIHTAVALTDDLTHRRWAHARHQVRLIVARAGTTQPAIQLAAVALLEVLEATIHPKVAVWNPLLADLHRAIDAALDDTGPRNHLG